MSQRSIGKFDAEKFPMTRVPMTKLFFLDCCLLIPICLPKITVTSAERQIRLQLEI